MMKKRKEKKRMKRRKRTLKFLMLMLLLTLIYLFAFKTNFFNIKDIKVVGNNKINYNQIVKASMCMEDENIFKINKNSGEEALEELPYIKKAEIKRQLPKGIVIDIEEREEIVAISHIGSFIYIDKEGYILSIEEKDEKIDLPQIFGLDLTELQLGKNVFQQIEDDNVIDFILLSNKAELLSKMRYINLSNKNSVMIELKDGIRVAFGPLNNVKYKMSFLFEILEDINKKDINAKQILLNKGDNPIILTDD